MINILSSNASAPSEAFREVKRERNENNLDWLSRNMPSNSDQGVLVMIGGKSPTDFRLRIAQSHARSDLTPSNWSHVMLLKTPAEKEGSLGIRVVHKPLNLKQTARTRIGRGSDAERYEPD